MKIFWFSPTEIIVDNESRTSKVPYSDTFYVLARTIITQLSPNTVKVECINKNVFVKSTVMKSTIDSAAVGE